MNETRFYLCAVPEPAWHPSTAQPGGWAEPATFAADALDCERRIAKGVNLEDEYSRYTLCCQRLEQAIVTSGHLKFIPRLKDFGVTLQGGQFPALWIPPGYLSTLALTGDDPGPERLGASFFLPEQVGQHRVAFALWAQAHGLVDVPAIHFRSTFLQAAEEARCGVVELQSAYHGGELPAARAIPQPTSMTETEQDAEGFVRIPDFAEGGVATEFFSKTGRKQQLATILRSQILEALKSGEPVTFGNQAPHDVITEVLNQFVFVPIAQEPRLLKLRVAYADGTEAEPFPLFCLPCSTTTPPDITPLRVALMSMRHLELDPEVDFCWFRNREVSRTRTLAETDTFCYQATLEQLRDSLAVGPLRIHLYHTGFEPAVLGFYRGVVQTLLRRRDQSLSVAPFYFRGGMNYQAGTEWR